jgi:ferredoxin
VYPRSRVELEVLDDRCTGCGLCAALAPGLMGIDGKGIAFARTRSIDWSPADGAWVSSCPTGAIVVHRDEDLATADEAA